MTADECLAALTAVHSALWDAHAIRKADNGPDSIAMGLASCATMVGDAGNRSARRAGRTAWNEADHAAACAATASLLALIPAEA